MGISGEVALAAAKKYTEETVIGGGALKGKNCVVDSISSITGGNRVTFGWTLDDGTEQSGTMDVMDGTGLPEDSLVEIPLARFNNNTAFYPQNGKIASTSSTIYSGKRFSVSGVDYVYVTFSTNERPSNAFTFVLFIDDSGNVISEECRVQHATHYVRQKLTVPAGATYCSVTYYHAEEDCVVEKVAVFNPLEGVNPIARPRFDGGYSNIMRKVGIIGDSISCGALDTNGGLAAVDNWDAYAWASFIKRKTGWDLVKLAQGGLQINNWLDTAYPGIASNPENKADSYIFMIGHNDQSVTPKGDIDDVDAEDLSQSNPDTLYGKFGLILNVIKEASPKSKWFFVTYPVIMSGTGLDTINTMIREVCAKVGGYLIDLATYDLYVKRFKPDKNSAHYTPFGYYYLSVEIMTYIDYIISHDLEDFADIGYVTKDYSYSG